MNPQILTVPLELKSNLKTRELEGHGSVFGNVDLGGDVVIRGAFKSVLAEAKKSGDMPGMYWMHDPSRPMGVWHEMAEDDRGLYVKGEIADTPLGNEIHALMKLGAVRKLSIGYKAGETAYDRDGNRMLKTIEVLRDVSPVSYAMNPLAKISAVKAQCSADGEYVPTEREMEQKFRDMGCSKKVARALVYRLFDNDRGGMLADQRWDAGGSDETAEVSEAIAGLLGRVRVASIKR